METKLPTAQEAADRLRAAAAAAGSRRSHRLRQPRHRPPGVHQQRGRARAGDPQDLGRRLDVALQRHLHRAEGSEEGRREERRRDPAAGDRRALGRRRHVEPAAVRGSARPGEAIGNGDLHDRPASRRGRPSSARGFKEAEFVLRQLAQETGGRAFFPNQVAELAGVYGQISDELSSQYTVGYTSRNPTPRRRLAPRRRARRPAERDRREPSRATSRRRR